MTHTFIIKAKEQQACLSVGSGLGFEEGVRSGTTEISAQRLGCRKPAILKSLYAASIPANAAPETGRSVR
jgi:hypothetical protein